MAKSVHPVAGVDFPSSLVELRSWFATDADCLDYLDSLRWPDGFVCPGCGGASGPRDAHGLRRCRECRRRVSATAGTIFQDTRTPLPVWFEAAWLMTVPTNGLSASRLARVLPVSSYQTAWTMLAKLRAAMSGLDQGRLSGTVELGEWPYGRTARTGAGLVGAVVELRSGGRGYGAVRLGVLANRSAWELRKFVRATVEPQSSIITEGLRPYQAALAGYLHQPRVGQENPALPGIHRVFSLVDRWLLGTLQGGVGLEHLQEYLDEFAFRWNHRSSRRPGLPFHHLMQEAVRAVPLTYHNLVRTGASTTVPPWAPAGRGGPTLL